MLLFTCDDYRGLHIEESQLDIDEQTFSEQLSALLSLAQQEAYRLIWITLTADKTRLIPTCLQQGFLIHNGHQQQVTLVKQINSTIYIPFRPTHTIGVGAIIIHQQQLLVVKTHKNLKSYQLPGGTVDQGEKISTSAEREVLEETGIHSELVGVFGLAAKYPVNYHMTNFYIVCQLKATSFDIDVIDTEEIFEARWVAIDDYLNDSNNSHFNRQIVAQSLSANVLKPLSQDGYIDPHAKQEIIFGHI